jgi:26S proteasome regulatory subunit N10
MITLVLCVPVLSVDNSEWTRNGDYAPTRFSAQNEAVGYLANAKLQENQESSVGLMSMAGNRIEVITSPGREPGQLRQSTNTMHTLDHPAAAVVPFAHRDV